MISASSRSKSRELRLLSWGRKSSIARWLSRRWSSDLWECLWNVYRHDGTSLVALLAAGFHSKSWVAQWIRVLDAAIHKWRHEAEQQDDSRQGGEVCHPVFYSWISHAQHGGYYWVSASRTVLSQCLLEVCTMLERGTFPMMWFK